MLSGKAQNFPCSFYQVIPYASLQGSESDRSVERSRSGSFVGWTNLEGEVERPSPIREQSAVSSTLRVATILGVLVVGDPNFNAFFLCARAFWISSDRA